MTTLGDDPMEVETQFISTELAVAATRALLSPDLFDQLQGDPGYESVGLVHVRDLPMWKFDDKFVTFNPAGPKTVVFHVDNPASALRRFAEANTQNPLFKFMREADDSWFLKANADARWPELGEITPTPYADDDIAWKILDQTGGSAFEFDRTPLGEQLTHDYNVFMKMYAPLVPLGRALQEWYSQFGIKNTADFVAVIRTGDHFIMMPPLEIDSYYKGLNGLVSGFYDLGVNQTSKDNDKHLYVFTTSGTKARHAALTFGLMTVADAQWVAKLSGNEWRLGLSPKIFTELDKGRKKLEEKREQEWTAKALQIENKRKELTLQYTNEKTRRKNLHQMGAQVQFIGAPPPLPPLPQQPPPLPSPAPKVAAAASKKEWWAFIYPKDKQSGKREWEEDTSPERVEYGGTVHNIDNHEQYFIVKTIRNVSEEVTVFKIYSTKQLAVDDKRRQLREAGRAAKAEVDEARKAGRVAKAKVDEARKAAREDQRASRENTAAVAALKKAEHKLRQLDDKIARHFDSYFTKTTRLDVELEAFRTKQEFDYKIKRRALFKKAEEDANVPVGSLLALEEKRRGVSNMEYYNDIFMLDERWYSGEHMLRTMPPYSAHLKGGAISAPLIMTVGSLPSGGGAQFLEQFEIPTPEVQMLGQLAYASIDRRPTNVQPMLTLQLRDGVFPWYLAGEVASDVDVLYTVDTIPPEANCTYNVSLEQLMTRYTVYVKLGDQRVPLNNSLSRYLVADGITLKASRWSSSIRTLYWWDSSAKYGAGGWVVNGDKYKIETNTDDAVRKPYWQEYDRPYRSDSAFIVLNIEGLEFANLPTEAFGRTAGAAWLHRTLAYRDYPRIGQLMFTNSNNIFGFVVNLGCCAPLTTVMLITRSSDAGSDAGNSATLLFKSYDNNLYRLTPDKKFVWLGGDYKAATKALVTQMGSAFATQNRTLGDYMMSMWAVGGNKPEKRFEPFTEEGAAKWWFSSVGEKPSHWTYINDGSSERPLQCIGDFVDVADAAAAAAPLFMVKRLNEVARRVLKNANTVVHGGLVPLAKTARKCWYCGVHESAVHVGAKLSLSCVNRLCST